MKRIFWAGFLFLLLAGGFWGLKSVNHRNQNRLLLAAIQNGDTQRLQLALRRGSDVNFRNSRGECALTLSFCETCDVQNSLILLQNGADVRVQNAKGRTPVELALHYGGEIKILDALIARGALVSPENALHIAVLRHDIPAIKKWLQRGVNVNCREPGSWTPLMWAAYDGWPDVADYLLKNGADVSLVDDENLTALDQAKNRQFSFDARQKKTLELLKAAQKARRNSKSETVK